MDIKKYICEQLEKIWEGHKFTMNEEEAFLMDGQPVYCFKDKQLFLKNIQQIWEEIPKNYVISSEDEFVYFVDESVHYHINGKYRWEE